MSIFRSWPLAGTVAAHHAFLGCAYFERFHNQKIKAFFRESVYAETRERIVINWVLNKASFLSWLNDCVSVIKVRLLMQATKNDPKSVLQAIDSYVAFCITFLSIFIFWGADTLHPKRICTK